MKTLPICGLFAGRRLTGSGHDGSQRVRFFQQRRQFLYGHDTGFNQQFEPERGFVGFFFHGPDFGNECRRTARAATSPIICRHRRAAANNLRRNRAPRGCFWNCAGQLDDSQCKFFRARFEFDGVHGIKSQIQSAIGDRQSAIPR